MESAVTINCYSRNKQPQTESDEYKIEKRSVQRAKRRSLATVTSEAETVITVDASSGKVISRIHILYFIPASPVLSISLYYNR